MQVVLCAVFALAINACTSVANSPQQPGNATEFDQVPPPNFTRGLLLRDDVQALYPIRARNLGVEGWVMLRFAVDADGGVMDSTIEIMQEEPPGFFDLAAINATRRLSFENLRGEPVEDIRYVFRFELEDLDRVSSNSAPVLQFRELIPRSFITPAYPPAAEQDGVQGYVVVRFTVTEEGSVRDVAVQESVPVGVFDSSALTAAARLRFEPRLIFGAPVAVENVTYRFDWRLAR